MQFVVMYFCRETESSNEELEIYYKYLLYLYINISIYYKPQGRIPTVRTPENIDKVKIAIVKTASRSVGRHSAAIGLSDRSVR